MSSECKESKIETAITKIECSVTLPKGIGKMKTIVTNRVILSEEAVYDYEYCIKRSKHPSWEALLEEAGGDSQKAWELAEPYERPTLKLDKRTLKADIREYINIMNQSGNLLYTRYFRCRWHDDYTGRTLMIFLYRAEKKDTKTERWWRIAGICDERWWSEELEDEGYICHWLKTFDKDMPKGDWVVDQIARAEADKLLGDTRQFDISMLPKEVQNAIKYGTSKDYTQAVPCFENTSKESFGRRKVKSGS